MGRMFDKDGSFHKNGWWQAHTTQQFQQHVQGVIHEYGSHTQALQQMCMASNTPHDALVNEQYGSQTVTEDMSDVVGTRLAYEAYFLDHPQGRLENDTVKQHFFYAYAQVWCARSDLEHTCDRIYNDVHPVPAIRVDSALRHLQYFTDAFHCRPSEPMGVESHINVYGASLDDSDQPPPQHTFGGYHGARDT